MEHAGFLRFEDEDEVSRAEGKVDFTPTAVVIRIGDTVAAELRPADLIASKVADGRYRLEVGGEGMIFEPSNPDSLDKELAAHAFSTRLSRAQSPAPVPAETSPTPTPVLAPRPTRRKAQGSRRSYRSYGPVWVRFTTVKAQGPHCSSSLRLSTSS